MGHRSPTLVDSFQSFVNPSAAFLLPLPSSKAPPLLPAPPRSIPSLLPLPSSSPCAAPPSSFRTYAAAGPPSPLFLDVRRRFSLLPPDLRCRQFLCLVRLCLPRFSRFVVPTSTDNLVPLPQPSVRRIRSPSWPTARSCTR
jgi:hypothetical protein